MIVSKNLMLYFTRVKDMVHVLCIVYLLYFYLKYFELRNPRFSTVDLKLTSTVVKYFVYLLKY